MKYIAALLAGASIALVIVGLATSNVEGKVVTRDKSRAETIYITNLAPKFISDAEIRRSIPAWEHAVNVDFAKYWHTTQYRLVFLGRKPAPEGQMSAVFQSKGPVKGALAYHWTERNNAPSITVYAGTGVYYGFSNSVSFTHELFELAADPVTSFLNVGYPLDYYYVQKPNNDIKIGFNTALGWFNEVSDPVESDYYKIGNVKISDFVTPAWFADGVGGRFDFMGLCQQPLWIRPGGYAQYYAADGWNVIYNFRSGHPEDAGFSKQDPGDRDAAKKP
jgi:hypothetical protein